MFNKFKLIPWKWLWKQIAIAQLNKMIELREELGEELELSLRTGFHTSRTIKFINLDISTQEILDWLNKKR